MKTRAHRAGRASFEGSDGRGRRLTCRGSRMPKMGTSHRPDGDCPRAPPPPYTQIGTGWIGRRDGVRRRGKGQARWEVQTRGCGGALEAEGWRREAEKTQRPGGG